VINEKLRDDVNYVVYAFNTLDAREIAFNVPDGDAKDIEKILEEDFGIESRKIEHSVHPDYLRMPCSY